MCGTWDTKQQDSIRQEVVEDKACVEEDDGPEDGQHFHIFGSKASKFAISMRVRSKPFAAEISISS